MTRVDDSRFGGTQKKLIFSKVMQYQSTLPKELICEIISGILDTYLEQIHALSSEI